jgi:hypothetical protein
METGAPGINRPGPAYPGMNKMFKKIALCAMLVLILIPASVMAAGMQGQGSGSANGAGSGMQSQSQTAMDSSSGEQSINSHGQGSGTASGSGGVQMARSGSCNGTCDQDMIRNMTRSQDQDMIRNMTQDMIRNMTQDMIQNMTRSQLRLGYESVLAGEGQGAGAGAGNGSGNGSGVLQQEGQIIQLQYQSSNMNRAQFGLTNVNGQLILATAADASGDRDRVMGRDMLRNQTHLQDVSCGNCRNL